MAWLRRVFRLPAHESNIGLVLIFCVISMSFMSIALVWHNIGLVLIFCVISMSFMSIALVWQAQIIANQREAIQWLERLKFGG